MTGFTEKIKTLRTRLDRKNHLDSVVEDLNKQYAELTVKCRQLETDWAREESDVETIENSSIAGFLLDLFGKKEEKLDKERQEAYSAKVKYDTAARELNMVKYDLDRYTAELESLQNADEEYARRLKEIMKYIQRKGVSSAEDRLALEENLFYLENCKKELEEAVSAGHSAASSASETITWLQKAEDMFGWDVFLDSILVDLQKHDYLDKARKNGEIMQQKLRAFKSELADVNFDENMDVQLDSFLSFADFFFDGLFTSLAVRDRIRNSKFRIDEIRNKIYRTLNILETMIADNDKQQSDTKEKINSFNR